jgi:hypothetical protein
MFRDDIRKQFTFSLNANLINFIYQEANECDDSLTDYQERQICEEVEQQVCQLIVKNEDINLFLVILNTIQKYK